MKHPESFLYVLILLLISTGVVSAGTTTLTTYYPAPAGRYDLLTANNVGIGVTDPGAYRLNVSGNANVTGNVTVTGTAIIPTISGNTHTTGDATVDGSVTASGFFYSSDSRLKKDIRPITHALDKVQHLNGIAFAWKKDNVRSIGVTAQDVEKVVPELVATGPNGMKSVAYGNLVALLIESVKEQQKQIDELRLELKQLKR